MDVNFPRKRVLHGAVIAAVVLLQKLVIFLQYIVRPNLHTAINILFRRFFSRVI